MKKTLVILSILCLLSNLYPRNFWYQQVKYIAHTIKNKKKINFTPNSYHNTPLHYAVMNDDFESVQQLCIQHPSIVTLENSLGCSALHYATNTKNLELFKLIISYFSAKEIKRKNNKGYSPRDIAQKKGFNEAIDIIDKHLHNNTL